MLSQLARARTARRRKKKKRVARGYGTPTPQCNGAAGSISSDANLLMDEVVDDDSLLATFSIWGSSPNRVVQYIEGYMVSAKPFRACKRLRHVNPVDLAGEIGGCHPRLRGY